MTSKRGQEDEHGSTHRLTGPKHGSRLQNYWIRT